MSDGDFELGRRRRETGNELRINLILGTVMLLAIIAQLVVAEVPSAPIHATPAMMASEAVLAAGCLLILAYLRSGPPYRSWRRQAISAFHLAAFTGLIFATHGLHEPAFTLLMPLPVFALLVALAGLRYDPRHVLLTGAAAVALHLVLVALAPPLHIRLPVAVAGAVLLAATTLAVARAVQDLVALHTEAVGKERLARFLAPEVLEQVIAAKELRLGAVEREVTVLFSDISGFTAMSSTMTPDEVVRLLNDYFPTMVDIVFRHGGTLEKYIGDALLAIWGAPVPMEDHAERAVRAAIEMQGAVAELNARWAREGRRTVAIHVGLNSGRVAAGHIGTAEYVQYACIGDTTNVSSRVCSVAQAGETVVSESTRQKLAGAGIDLAALEPVRVKGKDEALQLYRVRSA
jgi:class 3 adenylate cyclase